MIQLILFLALSVAGFALVWKWINRGGRNAVLAATLYVMATVTVSFGGPYWFYPDYVVINKNTIPAVVAEGDTMWLILGQTGSFGGHWNVESFQWAEKEMARSDGSVAEWKVKDTILHHEQLGGYVRGRGYPKTGAVLDETVLRAGLVLDTHSVGDGAEFSLFFKARITTATVEGDFREGQMPQAVFETKDYIENATFYVSGRKMKALRRQWEQLWYWWLLPGLALLCVFGYKAVRGN